MPQLACLPGIQRLRVSSASLVGVAKQRRSATVAPGTSARTVCLVQALKNYPKCCTPTRDARHIFSVRWIISPPGLSMQCCPCLPCGWQAPQVPRPTRQARVNPEQPDQQRRIRTTTVGLGLAADRVAVAGAISVAADPAHSAKEEKWLSQRIGNCFLQRGFR